MLAFFLFFSFFAGDLFCHITQTLLSPVLSWSGLTTSTQGTVQAVVCRAGCTAYKAACRSVVTVTPSRLTCDRECQYLQVSTFTYSVASALLYFFFLSLSLSSPQSGEQKPGFKTGLDLQTVKFSSSWCLRA